MIFRYRKLLALLMAAAMLALCLGGCSFRQYETEEHVYEADENIRLPRFNLPYTPDGSKTEIRRIFTSDVDNPDNGFTHGDRVATIIVRNRSMQFMSFAHITVRLMDDSIFEFQTYNIPTERDMIAFEINGKELPEDPLIKVISVDNVFTDKPNTLGNRLASVINGNTATLTNQTRQPMDVNVSFHALNGDEDKTLLGGMAYSFRLTLAPEESQTITVDEAVGREIELMTANTVG